MFKLKNKDLLTIDKLTKKEILSLIDLTQDVKENKEKYRSNLKSKKLALIFQKPSTRTRLSFEGAISDLGGYSTYLSSNDMQLAYGEAIVDTAKVMERYVDFVAIRTYQQRDVIDFAKNTSIPTINALTNQYHPCQAISDIYTIFEKKPKIEKFVYLGDANNVCNSLMLITQKLNIDMVVSSPEGYQPKDDILKKCRNVEVVEDPKRAVENADVVYTDTWVSMHQKDEKDKRIKKFMPYQVTNSLMSLAKDKAYFMHCLPAYRGYEVLDEVIDSKKSIVFDQAENRLHTQKAILLAVNRN